MQHWNNLHRDAQSDTNYVFDVEETKVGDRQATQFLLDMTKTYEPAPPELRQVMEQFFGPGGKMRWWIVPLDDQTVLLAAATPEQVSAAVQTLDRRAAIDWSKPELEAANKLLAERAEWRFFFSPRGHYAWKRRQNEAMNNGVPVIGAKPAKDFPASPPIAFSGIVENDELRIEIAISSKTIASAGNYFKE
jgi:hypothetical protein